MLNFDFSYFQFTASIKRDLILYYNKTELHELPYWKVKENCSDPAHELFYKALPHQRCDEYSTIYFLSDQDYPSAISSIVAQG